MDREVADTEAADTDMVASVVVAGISACMAVIELMAADIPRQVVTLGAKMVVFIPAR
jgi:hypothetical protein